MLDIKYTLSLEVFIYTGGNLLSTRARFYLHPKKKIFTSKKEKR